MLAARHDDDDFNKHNPFFGMSNHNTVKKVDETEVKEEEEDVRSTETNQQSVY